MKLSKSKLALAKVINENGGWIEWNGGECPVGKGTLVDVKCANGIINFGVSAMTNRSDANHTPGTAVSFTASNWGGDLPLSGIIAYRLHKPDVKPEFCESVTRSIPEPEANPTIEQLAQDYRNKLDLSNRKQQDADDAKAAADDAKAAADDAKAAADAALGELERAGEVLGILIGIAKSDREPELVITDWRDLKVGDVVEITGSSNNCWKDHSGQEMTVKNVYPDDGHNDSQVYFIGESGAWYLGGNTTWRFIRRP